MTISRGESLVTMAMQIQLESGRLSPLPRPLVVQAGQGSDAEAASSAGQDERSLVRRSLQRDEDAYRQLIERHQQHVASIVWKFTRDAEQHETLVHDTFVEAYLSLKSYRAEAPFEHWISRIATRVGYRHWKQEARRRKVETAAVENFRLREQTTPTAGERERVRALREMLGRLKPRDRLVLTLRYVEGYDVKEVARLTGFSESLVKVQSMRARKRLKKLYDESMKGDAS